MKITLISAVLDRAQRLVLYQYTRCSSAPDTVSGIAVSLQMVFARRIVGGLFWR